MIKKQTNKKLPFLKTGPSAILYFLDPHSAELRDPGLVPWGPPTPSHCVLSFQQRASEVPVLMVPGRGSSHHHEVGSCLFSLSSVGQCAM